MYTVVTCIIDCFWKMWKKKYNEDKIFDKSKT